MRPPVTHTYHRRKARLGIPAVPGTRRDMAPKIGTPNAPPWAWRTLWRAHRKIHAHPTLAPHWPHAGATPHQHGPDRWQITFWQRRSQKTRTHAQPGHAPTKITLRDPAQTSVQLRKPACGRDDAHTGEPAFPPNKTQPRAQHELHGTQKRHVLPDHTQRTTVCSQLTHL